MPRVKNIEVNEDKDLEQEDGEEKKIASATDVQRFLSPEEEKDIIRRVQGGDVAAFEDLVNAYKQKAYYVALGFVGNHEDALDLSQDAFVKAF